MTARTLLRVFKRQHTPARNVSTKASKNTGVQNFVQKRRN